MNTYLVRLKNNREIVGLFVSPSDDMLWEFVDECCDAHDCEFVKLPPGGLYLGTAAAPTIPTEVEYPEDEKDIPDWFAGATLSELWIDIFFSKASDPEWQPVEPSD